MNKKYRWILSVILVMAMVITGMGMGTQTVKALDKDDAVDNKLFEPGNYYIKYEVNVPHQSLKNKSAAVKLVYGDGTESEDRVLDWDLLSYSESDNVCASAISVREATDAEVAMLADASWYDNWLKGIKVKSETGAYINYIKVSVCIADTVLTLAEEKSRTFSVAEYITADGSEFMVGSGIGYVTVTLTTPDEKNSGTDANVMMYMTDENGKKSDEVNISKAVKLDGGYTESFRFPLPEGFGTVDNIYLKSDQSGSASGWKMGTLKVANAGSFTIKANHWFLDKNYHSFGKDSGDTGAFKFTIQTKDKLHAGTDSEIWFKLTGSNGTTTEDIEITGYDNNADDLKNGFEQGDTDEVRLAYNVEGLGDIKSLTINKNDDGIGPDWWLDYVIVEEIAADGTTVQQVRFDYDEYVREDTVTLVNPTIVKALRGSDSGNIEINIARGECNLVVYDDEPVDIEPSFPVNPPSPECEPLIPVYVIDELINRQTVLNVDFMKGDQLAYSFHIDGSKLEKAQELKLGAAFEKVEDGILVTLSGEHGLPAGVTLEINRQGAIIIPADDLYEWLEEHLGEYVSCEKTVKPEEVISITDEPGVTQFKLAVVDTADEDGPVTDNDVTEPAQPETDVTEPETDITQPEPADPLDEGTVQTGDDSNMLIPLAIMIAAAIVLIAVVVRRKK